MNPITLWKKDSMRLSFWVTTLIQIQDNRELNKEHDQWGHVGVPREKCIIQDIVIGWTERSECMTPFYDILRSLHCVATMIMEQWKGC